MTELVLALKPFSNLVFLTLALVTPVVILLMVRFFSTSRSIRIRLGARIELSLFLLLTGSAHFVSPEQMSLMLPGWVPQRLALIYLTGALELSLAAGLLVRGWEKPLGAIVVAMMFVFLPANIYAAWYHLPFGGNEIGPAYLWVRIPYQVFVVCWALWATGWTASKVGLSAESA